MKDRNLIRRRMKVIGPNSTCCPFHLIRCDEEHSRQDGDKAILVKWSVAVENSRKRLLYGAIIIGAGVILAFLFRKPYDTANSSGSQIRTSDFTESAPRVPMTGPSSVASAIDIRF